MSIEYASVGSNIRSEQLNALTEELDTICKALLCYKTPLIYWDTALRDDGYHKWAPTSFPLGKTVYMGDSGLWKVIPLIDAGATEYDHSAFTTAEAAMTVESWDLDKHLIINSTDPWPLDGSIEAHARTDGGFQWYWSPPVDSGRMRYRERFRKIATLDIVLEAVPGSALTWESAWNKYHFLRFHNLDPSATTVTLPGGSTITLDPFGVQTVRRGYPNLNTWDTTYQYLWKCEHGDSLYWDAEPSNNVASMVFYHRLLDAMSAKLGFDPRVVWDGSDLLPETIDLTKPIRNLMYELGRMISWTNASSGAPIPHDFTPTWSELESVSGTNGVRYDPTLYKLDNAPAEVNPVDVVGITSNFAPQIPATLPVYYHDIPQQLLYWAGGYKIYGLTDRYWDDGTSAWIDVDTTSGVQWIDGSWGANSSTSIETSVYDLTHIDTYTGTGSSPHNPPTSATLPTISVMSDGWRVVGCGTATINACFSGGIPSDDVLRIATVVDLGYNQYQFSIPFGYDLTKRTEFNLWGRPPAYFRKYPGKISDYVGFTDVFGVVTHEGHADIVGTYGIEWMTGHDAGEDFYESRQATSESALRVTERLPTYAFTETYSLSTNTIPIYPTMRSTESIAANAADGAWYASNRTQLLSGTPTTTEQQKARRIPIMAVHHNHIAQRLNSVISIVPLTLDEIIYYGGGPSGVKDGTWVDPVYPDRFYCAVLSASARADDIGLSTTAFVARHLDLNVMRDWAATLGVRFFVRRCVGIRKYVGGVGYIKTSDSTDVYRTAPADWITLAYHVTDSSGYLADPKQSQTQTEPMVVIEASVEYGDIPAGWKMDGFDAVMLTPTSVINYVRDPLIETALDQYKEPLEENPTVGQGYDNSIGFYPAGSWDNATMTHADAKTTMYPSLPDAQRWPFRVQPFNRFLLVRDV